ncbi:MAG: hypothetical protein ACM37Z_13995 [Deltaproteobacteria bacterium]
MSWNTARFFKAGRLGFLNLSALSQNEEFVIQEDIPLEKESFQKEFFCGSVPPNEHQTSGEDYEEQS